MLPVPASGLSRFPVKVHTSPRSHACAHTSKHAKVIYNMHVSIHHFLAGRSAYTIPYTVHWHVPVHSDPHACMHTWFQRVMRACVTVCVCVCARARLCMCACVHVCARTQKALHTLVAVHADGLDSLACLYRSIPCACVTLSPHTSNPSLF